MNTEEVIWLLGSAGAVLAADRRVQERQMPCDPIPVRISAQDSHATSASAHVINVSKSGLCLRSDKPFKRGMKITVDMNGAFISGDVCYCIHDRDNSALYKIGLKIDDF
jgi:PilZ domain